MADLSGYQKISLGNAGICVHAISGPTRNLEKVSQPEIELRIEDRTIILFGHPTGNPNSHHAALAHWEAGRLEAFCVPWFPERWELETLKLVPGLRSEVERLSRRRFEALAEVPMVQGRLGEWGRMICRMVGGGEEISWRANEWLMKTMAKESSRPGVKAVHSYEDCSLWQFQSAKKMGKACIYDMPIGYYGWWQEKEAHLAKKYAEWLPPGGISSSRWVRPEQKKKEMELADLILAPSTFAAQTIRAHFNKPVHVVPYGTDLVAQDDPIQRNERKFRFLFSGTSSVRKGTPFLLETWKKLQWKDAELYLVGSWQLEPARLRELPEGVTYFGPLSRTDLWQMYQSCDWLIHPSNFEGFSLSILEALGAELPVVASTATGAADLPQSESVQLFEPEKRDELVVCMERAKKIRGADIGRKAMAVAKVFTWKKYREGLSGIIHKNKATSQPR